MMTSTISARGSSMPTSLPCRASTRDRGRERRFDRIVLVWLADATVVVYLAYLAFIPVGGVLALRWPRLIGPHLAAVALALVSITIGFDCPLTTWEQSLRRQGGQRPYTTGYESGTNTCTP
jgi:hypothetical protein